MIVLLCLMLFPSLLFAQGQPSAVPHAFTLTWTAPTENADGSALEPNDLAGYVVYSWDNAADVGNKALAGYTNRDIPATVTTYTLELAVPPGTYHAALYAYDPALNESARSNTVELVVPETPVIPPDPTPTPPNGDTTYCTVHVPVGNTAVVECKANGS